ncbi:MAG: alpha/beta fold hydrolase [Gemmatimonadetes bacterium]|nr:alpha/beta fold hydrolase [Gemmatimonadota bacterium]MBK8647356.1 alpha/beta fold hydrolase [Gemmatimonadota bacterium]
MSSPFRPLPVPASDSAFRPAWWLTNPHASTMWGKFFRTPPPLDARIERWDTPDGDVLDLVRLAAPPTAPTFLLLHGLEGSMRSHYAAGTLREAQRAGWQANLLLFRSCNGELNRAPRSYHSGETTDLAHVVGRLLDERGGTPLILAGVSLGANVLLKWLGEQGRDAVGRVQAAVAVSAPFDLARSCAQIDRGLSRVYAWNFLKSLRSKAVEKIRQHPGIADPARVLAARSLWSFDDAFTSVVHGFRDAADYYYRSSSIRYLRDIRVPTLLLSARDDPFHPPDVLDDVARIAAGNPALHLEFPARGGHVGFVEGRSPARVTYYMERRIPEFAAAQLAMAGTQARSAMEGSPFGR